MNSEFTFTFARFFEESKSISKKLDVLKECALLPEEDYKQALEELKNVTPSNCQRRTIFFFVALVKKLYDNAREGWNELSYIAILRTFRSWVGRAFLLCFLKNKYPQHRLDSFSQMEDLYEIFIEWKSHDIENHVLLEELSFFLDFEDSVLTALIYGEPREMKKKTMECYVIFSEKSTFASGFLLVRSMADQFGLEYIKRNINEDLSRFRPLCMLYHISARMEVIDVLWKKVKFNPRVLSKSKMREVRDIYLKGIEETQFATALWKLYLELMNTLRQLSNGTSYSLNVTIYWVKARISAQGALQLSANNTQELLDELTFRHAWYLSVITTGNKQYPLCTELWLRLLRYHIHHFTNNVDTLLRSFNSAVETLRGADAEDLLALFILFTDFLKLVNPDLCKEIFARGVKLRPDLCKLLIFRYVTWYISSAGLPQARKVLGEDYIDNAPLEFFKFLLEAERTAYMPEPKAIRSCFEVALYNYGARDESIWEDYINFELSRLGEPGYVPKVYGRAKLIYQSVDGRQVLADLHRNTPRFRRLVPKL